MGSDLIVITDSDLPGNATENVLSDAGYRVVRASCATAQDVLDVATGARALIVQWAPITAAVIDSLDTCEFISRIGIGLDMIDLDAATSHGIAVANTPDYCVEEVAAHTAALVLAGTRACPHSTRGHPPKPVGADRACTAGTPAVGHDSGGTRIRSDRPPGGSDPGFGGFPRDCQ